jgi:hypothetical protein
MWQLWPNVEDWCSRPKVPSNSPLRMESLGPLVLTGSGVELIGAYLSDRPTRTKANAVAITKPTMRLRPASLTEFDEARKRIPAPTRPSTGIRGQPNSEKLNNIGPTRQRKLSSGLAFSLPSSWVCSRTAFLPSSAETATYIPISHNRRETAGKMSHTNVSESIFPLMLIDCRCIITGHAIILYAAKPRATTTDESPLDGDCGHSAPPRD